MKYTEELQFDSAKTVRASKHVPVYARIQIKVDECI